MCSYECFTSFHSPSNPTQTHRSGACFLGPQTLDCLTPLDTCLKGNGRVTSQLAVGQPAAQMGLCGVLVSKERHCSAGNNYSPVLTYFSAVGHGGLFVDLMMGLEDNTRQLLLRQPEEGKNLSLVMTRSSHLNTKARVHLALLTCHAWVRVCWVRSTDDRVMGISHSQREQNINWKRAGPFCECCFSGG